MTAEDRFWNRLQAELDRRVAAAPSVAAAAVLDLSSGRLVGTDEGVPFPVASTIKIHLLAALGELDAAGELSLSDTVRLDPKSPGSGVLTYLDDLAELTWRDLATLMIIVSDNTATNLTIERIGIERMEGFLRTWGLEETRLQRKMHDHEAVAEGRENVASARDLLRMLALLHRGTAFAPGVAAWCLDVLGRPKKSPFSATLPATARLANKPGGMERVRCDAGIVDLPNRPFAMVALSTFGTLDQEPAARWVGDVGRAIYDAMVVLDGTSVFGQGIPAGTPRGSAGAEAPQR